MAEYATRKSPLGITPQGSTLQSQLIPGLQVRTSEGFTRAGTAAIHFASGKIFPRLSVQVTVPVCVPDTAAIPQNPFVGTQVPHVAGVFQ